MANKPQVNLKFIKGYGENFKKLRETKGLTQNQLYNEIHISDKSISLIEKEQRVPTIEQINIYCEYFNVSLDYLTGRTKIANPTNQMISDYTGLSDKAIDTLIEFKEENKATWYGDTINSILENIHFCSIVIELTHLATSHNLDQKIDQFKYLVTKKEILETILNKQFSLMIDSIVKEYEPRKENAWYRMCYELALGEYQKGKLTDEQYQQILNEFNEGNFESVPDYFKSHGGADNG